MQYEDVINIEKMLISIIIFERKITAMKDELKNESLKRNKIDKDKISFVEGENFDLSKDDIVNLKESSKQFIICYSKNKNKNLNRYKRISKTEYYDTDTRRDKKVFGR